MFLGSFNLDPRHPLNTEVAVLVESPRLAEQVAGCMDTGVQPETSYWLDLETDVAGSERLIWITDADGERVRYTSDPEAGAWHGSRRG